jgi:hypothetical protein
VAADRRLVHTALRDWAGLQTVSVDEDPETGMKRVQITRVGYVPGSESSDGSSDPWPEDEPPPEPGTDEPLPPVQE